MVTDFNLLPLDLAAMVKILTEAPTGEQGDFGAPFLAWPTWATWQVIDKTGQMHRVKTLSHTASWEDVCQNLKHGGVVLLLKAGQPCGVLNNEIIVKVLLQQNQRLQATVDALLDTTDEAITIIDESSIVKGWNAKAEQLYQIKQADIIGKNIDDFFASLVVTKQLGDVLAEPQEVRDKYHQPVPDTHVLINASAMTSAGRLIGAVAAEREITQMMRLADELAHSHRGWHNLQTEINKLSQPAAAFNPSYQEKLPVDQQIDGDLASLTDKLEREAILQALAETLNDRSKAAKLLGIPRSTFYYKLKKHQIALK